jgi:hypothetical protein
MDKRKLSKNNGLRIYLKEEWYKKELIIDWSLRASIG